MPFCRSSPAWAVLQLRDGFNLSMPLPEAEREFRARWPAHTFRFPAVKQGCLDPDSPLSAYVFVEPPVDASFERSALIAMVLRDPGTRAPILVTEEELRAMLPAPTFPPVASTVMVTAGDFSGLEGTVVAIQRTTCTVLIELWSRRRVIHLAPGEFQPT